MIDRLDDYKEAKVKCDLEFKAIEEHKIRMKNAGLDEKHIQLAIDPLISFALKLKEEIEEFEKLI